MPHLKLCWLKYVFWCLCCYGKAHKLLINIVRNKSKLFLAHICISPVCCKEDCKLHFVKTITSHVAAFFLQTEGIWCESVRLSLCRHSAVRPLLRTTILLYAHKWETTMWDYFDLQLCSRERNPFCYSANYCTTPAGKVFL